MLLSFMLTLARKNLECKGGEGKQKQVEAKMDHGRKKAKKAFLDSKLTIKLMKKQK